MKPRNGDYVILIGSRSGAVMLNGRWVKVGCKKCHAYLLTGKRLSGNSGKAFDVARSSKPSFECAHSPRHI